MLFQTLETQQCSLPNPPSRYLVRSGLARPLANQNIEPQLKQAVSKKNYAGSGGSYEPELQHLQLGGTYLSIEKTTVRIHTSFMQTFTYAQCVFDVCAKDVPFCMVIHGMLEAVHGPGEFHGLLPRIGISELPASLLPYSEPAGQATHPCWRVPCWSVLCPGKAMV